MKTKEEEGREEKRIARENGVYVCACVCGQGGGVCEGERKKCVCGGEGGEGGGCAGGLAG